jgi:hypothetical protein
MTWLILTQLVILSFLSFNKDRLKSTASLRLAWNWYICVFFAHAFFTIFRASNYKDMDLALVEIWATGFVWLFLGMSIFQLPSLFLGDDHDSPEIE